jgi:hypothetical protein
MVTVNERWDARDARDAFNRIIMHVQYLMAVIISTLSCKLHPSNKYHSNITKHTIKMASPALCQITGIHQYPVASAFSGVLSCATFPQNAPGRSFVEGNPQNYTLKVVARTGPISNRAYGCQAADTVHSITGFKNSWQFGDLISNAPCNSDVR